MKRFRLLFLAPLMFAPFPPALADAPQGSGVTLSPANPSVAKQLVSEADLGIKVTALRLSGVGNLVDFRYRVLDAHKAAPLFDAKIKPRLFHEASGKNLDVPEMGQVGSLRTKSRGAPVATGKVYTMLFGNPGQAVRYGTTVNLVIGDRVLAKLLVKEMPYDWVEPNADAPR